MPKEIDGVKYFTQDELDGVITDRLARVEKKPADYDEIKSQLAEAQGTITEKDAALTAAIETAKAEAKAEASGEFQPLITNAEIRAAAAASKFRSADDALAHFGDVSSVWKDGALDSEAVRTRLAEIATNKPYLLNAEPEIPGAGEAGIGVGGSAAPTVAPGISRLASAFNESK